MTIILGLLVGMVEADVRCLEKHDARVVFGGEGHTYSDVVHYLDEKGRYLMVAGYVDDNGSE
jgi:hypothetical protein